MQFSENYVLEFVQFISRSPIEFLIPTLLIGTLGGFLLTGIFRLIFWGLTRRIVDLDDEQIRELKVKLDEEDTIRIHKDILSDKSFPIKRGQRAKIYGLKKYENGRGEYGGWDIEPVWSKGSESFKDSIQLNRDQLDKLFPNSNVEDNVVCKFGFQRISHQGFERYWNHENDATKFANRFAVYLTLAIFIIELGFPLLFSILGN